VGSTPGAVSWPLIPLSIPLSLGEPWPPTAPLGSPPALMTGWFRGARALHSSGARARTRSPGRGYGVTCHPTSGTSPG
jgi:hypothetical protein